MGVTNISIKSPVGGKYDSHPALTGPNAANNKAAISALIADLSLMVLSGQSQAGVGNTDIDFQGSGSRASCTVTVGTVVAGNTLVINAVTLTAADAPAGASQFKSNTGGGGVPANVAQDIVRCINSQTAPAGILGVVRAWCNPGSTVVTVECIYPGTIGNSITCTQTGGTLTVSASPLTGGVVGGIVRPNLP
jgi:hypothetical protein